MKTETAAFNAGRRSNESCSRNVRNVALFAAGVLVALGCAAAAPEPWPEPESNNQGATPAATTATDHVDSSVGRPADELDPLRNNAAMGDPDSAVQLTEELIDRYETSRSRDDLFEAVLWIERFHGTESLAHSGVINRVGAKHCDEKVLHFHWMCSIAE